MKWVVCVLGEETVCVPAKMHGEQRIWAEIVQIARAPPKLECFLPSPPSVCNTSVVRVRDRDSSMLKQIWYGRVSSPGVV